MSIIKATLFFAVTILIIGCASRKANKVTSPVMNSTGIPVQEQAGETSLPLASFDARRLVINAGNYIFTAESVDKGTLTYGDGKMDIYGKDGVNAGKHFMAIYKLENGLLTICYNLKGDGYPAAFETKSKPALFMAVFKKE